MDMCASPAPPASGRTAKLPPMPVRKHQEGGIEDLTWLKHFPSTQRALQLDVEDDAGAQQPNTRALQLDCKAALPSLSVMLSAACAGQASLQSVKSWLFGPLWLTRSCRKTTFRTRSEGPGVHQNVAVHMILRKVRGHKACFRLCSCSAHIAVCSFAAILSSWQDNVLCRASLDLQRHERAQKSMF